MRNILAGVAPQSAPMEGTEYYLDHSGDRGPHYHDDDTIGLDRLFTELQVREALPIYGDTEWDCLHNADTYDEVASAYRSIMIRRLGVPSWFAMMMTLTGMVDTWESALRHLVTPSGEALTRIDESVFVRSSVYEDLVEESYYEVAAYNIPNPEFVEPFAVWGDGPVTLNCKFPMFLLRLEHPYIYYMHIGDLQNDKQLSMLPRAPSSEGPAIKAVLKEPISRLTQLKLDEFANAGAEWDLHYNLAR
tara:strand:+ start:2168 stop:2908 length:741 start_codon:yes stop_codon:yes gene_type:complete